MSSLFLFIPGAHYHLLILTVLVRIVRVGPVSPFSLTFKVYICLFNEDVKLVFSS